MKLSNDQLKELARQLDELKNVTKTEQPNEINVDSGPERADDGGQGNERPANSKPVEQERAPVRKHADGVEDKGNDAGLEQRNNSESAPQRVSLGTPPRSGAALTVDSLNSKSVEWMAANLDKVNELIAV